MRTPISFAFALLALVPQPAAPAARIDLVSCPEEFGEGALCGWAPVPEDWSHRSGRMIQIRVVVLPALDGDSGAPLVPFPGGPGQAATDLVPLVRQVYPEVQRTRDVVFIDQRGSGASNPMTCPVDLSGDPFPAFGQLWDPARIGECWARAREHADPSLYTTADYVADVAHVLDELGYPTAMLWGGSGGTRTATAFIRAFPERVVGAVLDGVTPIDYGMPVPFSRHAQEAWGRVVEDCGRQLDCRDAFPDLSGDFGRIQARLAAGPVPVSVRSISGDTHEVQLHLGDFAYSVRGILYNAGQTARLPLEVHRAAETGDLSFFAQALYNRSAALLGGVMAVGLHLSVYCAEDVPTLEEAAVTSTGGTFIGSYLVEQYRGACRAWPVEPVPESWYEGFDSDVPVLMVSGYYDPSTPPEAAEEVRKSLRHSQHIVVRNMGHGAGFTCARPVIQDFLITGSLEGFADPCQEGPIRFEVG